MMDPDKAAQARHALTEAVKLEIARIQHGMSSGNVDTVRDDTEKFKAVLNA